MNEKDQRKPENAAEFKEWIKEIHGIYAGLIAIGIVMIQPFMYHGEYVGIAAAVCVVSFAISIPVLAALLLLNFAEEFRRHLSYSKAVSAVRLLGQVSGGIGVIAGFWHISPIAGIASASACLLGLVVYSVAYAQLYRRSKSR